MAIWCELALLFFKLGLTSFGGPVVHIALMEQEVVARRGWLTQDQFLDLLGVTNLIPGPNSTEMALHIGYIRGGGVGLVVAGMAFILPATLFSGGFAWAYVHFGMLPALAPVLQGIKPVVIAVIFTALWRLGKRAITTWPLGLMALGVATGALLGINVVLLLLLGGLWGVMGLGPATRLLALGAWGTQVVHAQSTEVGVSLSQLGWIFLKVGSVLFGSGYVLVAFLEGELVRGTGWLTQAQLIDAIAIGQFTPGPVLSTATFIGYILAGVPGAIVATVGIFLPSFLFVAVLNPWLPKLRSFQWMSLFINAVNAGSVALMAAVTLKLALSLVHSPITVGIALISALAGIRFKIDPLWLVLGGGLSGWLLFSD